MIVVGNSIISEDIADRCFCCDLAQCKGQCCVDGDAGAPLEKAEIETLKEIYPKIRPFMTAQGIAEAESNGLHATDSEGVLCTPLVNNRECAYAFFEDGIAKCAIEKAFFAKEIKFRKPISCHLYPLRIDDYGEFQTINYHSWDICKSAVCKGENTNLPLYIYLKEPLTRKFGQDWYDELVARCEEFLQQRHVKN
ncbi:MAG: DUF3109 family protein [Bacteroidales bacterium]|nr:DUF3109 family protein [Bacteroidales bacterium]